MASNQASAFAFIIVVIALFAKATTPANGQILGLNPLNGLSVTGQLCCTPTGNCLLGGGQGLAGAVVKLNCSTRLFGASTTVGQSMTNAAGFFTITVPRVQGLILGLPIVPCVAIVQLPVGSELCSTLSSTSGALVSGVRGVGTVVSGILGRIQNATTTGFITLRI